jgi:hypothetical protein
MIELHFGDGRYLILSVNHEDYSADLYLHKHGQIMNRTLERNVKKVSQLLEYIQKYVKETTNA